MSRILLVEDSPLQARRMARLLEREGHSVSTVADGDGALVRAREEKFDIALVDIVLPDISGIEVCRILKRNGDYAKIPVVLVSGIEEPDLVLQGFAAGANDFVAKRGDMETLLARILAALQRIEGRPADVSVGKAGTPRDLDILGKRVRVEVDELHPFPYLMSGFEEFLAAQRERHHAREQFLREQLAQAQKMEAIGRLSGGVAHDFNNLLTAIMGYADLIKLEAGEGSAPYSRADSILAISSRAAALTHQLLSFSRRQVLQPRVVDLNEVVRASEGMLTRMIPESIELSYQISPDTLPTFADAHQLSQVLLNLIVNARDAVGQEGCITVRTGCTIVAEGDCLRYEGEVRPGPHVLLEVIDTGAGMDEETRKQIFEPFFTTKGAGEGTGLGLSMVYGIIAQSEGFIQVDSHPGKGTRFRVHLPLSDEPLAAPSPVPVQREGPAPKPGPLTILVVEDSEELRVVMKSSLAARGHRVLEAANGALALVAIQREECIDLMITDLVMPLINGAELAQRVQEIWPELRILYMSGYSRDAQAKHYLLDPSIPFLSKPFTPSELLSAVDALFGT